MPTSCGLTIGSTSLLPPGTATTKLQVACQQRSQPCSS
jgi:hypothetical protein